MSRTVTLVLVDPRGRLLGALPSFPVATPWWPDVGQVVSAAQEAHGVRVTVLRLLHADRPEPHGGKVTYLAEVAELPAGDGLRASTVDLSPHPARAPWAVPGGPAASLAWAQETLAGLGHAPVRPVQERTWNLSGIWRLVPVAGAGVPTAWLKQVPDFFRHEAAVLRWLNREFPALAPRLLASGPQGRLLLEHVVGVDRHGASPAERDQLAADMHAVQVRAADQVDELAAAGVPDRRGAKLVEAVSQALAGHGADLPPVARALAELPARLAAAADCGLPETLVHGDLHPGNLRASGGHRVILDWGDSFLGHPAFDLLRLTEDIPDGQAAGLLESWAARWRASVPACDPERAVTVLRPVAALVAAAAYARFLARIEPSEWPYHAADVPRYLARLATPATTS